MIVIRTPLRISLFGGGTDFASFYENNGGVALGMAIDKYVRVILKPRFDSKIRVGYTVNEEVNNVNDVKHELIRECLKYMGVENGLEIITVGDIPGGSGLGSSSAVTVGTLQALHFYKDSVIKPIDLAKEACHIEIDVLNKPIGIQDQFISVYGGFRLYEFIGNREVIVSSVNPFAMWDLLDNLILFDTGIVRQSSDILTEQNHNTHNNFKILNEMKSITYTAFNALSEGRISAIGPLLHGTWTLKKKLSEKITTTQIDEWYYRAIHAGADGGKLVGAGGGGFLLFYCEPKFKNDVRAALCDLKEMPFKVDENGSTIVYRE